MPDALVPGGALAATTRIQNRHKAIDALDVYNQPIEARCAECAYAVWPCSTRADAGVVAERLHEAIRLLEEIRDREARFMRTDSSMYRESVAALDCLRGTP